MKIRKLLKVSSLIEIIVGLSLVLFPSKLVYLLFDIDDSEVVKTLGRLTGITLLCLGSACWAGKDNEDTNNIIPAVRAMFTYNSLVAIYFTYLRIVTGFDGLLLLPALVLHAVIAICFVYLLLRKEENS